MAAKKVLQYECDRCPNVWYVPADAKEQPELDIQISVNLPGEAPTKMQFACLCEGCLKTVTNLLVSIGRVTKKVSANRKAKKKDELEAASKDSSLPAATDTSKPSVAPVAAVASPGTSSALVAHVATVVPVQKPSVVSVPAVGAASAGKAPPLVAVHPKK